MATDERKAGSRKADRSKIRTSCPNDQVTWKAEFHPNFQHRGKARRQTALPHLHEVSPPE